MIVEFLIIILLLIKVDKIVKYILIIVGIISKWMKIYWDLRKDIFKVILECWVGSLRWYLVYLYLFV